MHYHPEALATRNIDPKICFTCGILNHFSHLPDVETINNELLLHCTLPDAYTSFSNIINYATIAIILDDVQGLLSNSTGCLVMTNRLHIKQIKPLYANERFSIRTWITRKREKRIFTRAEIKNNTQEICYTCSGSWYVIPYRLMVRMINQTNISQSDIDRILKNLQKLYK